MSVVRSLHRRLRGALAALAALAIAAPAAHAQTAGKGFLFQAPRWTLAVRGGLDRANARSDLFDFVTDSLTLDRGDFQAVNVSLDLAYSLMPRLDLAFNAGYSRSKAPSEFRKYIGTDDLPITQTTTFVRAPITASLKGYLTPRGQSIGTLAWVPSRFAPFVGVGGGAMRYRFEQNGEFVDSESANLDVFRDRLVSTGWTPAVQGLAGFDVALSPRWGLTTEAKYTWARVHTGFYPDEDFQNYRIDLSGLSATMGLHVRF
jgi:outer membrane protein W